MLVESPYFFRNPTGLLIFTAKILAGPVVTGLVDYNINIGIIPFPILNSPYSKYFGNKNVKKRKPYSYMARGFLAFLAQKMKNMGYWLFHTFKMGNGITQEGSIKTVQR